MTRSVFSHTGEGTRVNPKQQGVDAEYVSLDSMVPDIEEEFYSQGPTLDQRFYDKLAVVFAERVKQCGPRVPVVTGRLISY